MCRPLQRYAAASEAGFRAGGWPGGRALCARASRFHSRNGYVSPYAITQLYADLGDKEHAFEWLNAAFQEYDISIISLRTDFSMDPLRSDPRYIELVRKVGYSDKEQWCFFHNSASSLFRQGLAPARESLGRGLGSKRFTERFHRNALVTHFQHGQAFCPARQLKDDAVTRCRLHQRAPQR